MKESAMKYLATDALQSLREAQEEVTQMRAKYAVLADGATLGPGLDMNVLREKLDNAAYLIEMLT